LRQELLPELERSRRLERLFKRAILVLTVVGVVGLVAGSTAGRFAVARTALRARSGVYRLLGYPQDREEIEAEHRLMRAQGIAEKTEVYRGYFEHEAKPEWRRVLEASGMAPGDAYVRWANVDGTVMLSSKVFEVDDSGRAYRFRPNTKSLWTSSQVLTRGLAGFFLLPDTPEVRSALVRAKVEILPESFQSTNSWGCRGPEPDPGAKARVLVVGDSFMQGMLVADDQTPPACLARTLREAWGESVSVLNTGHIGYSPEQYYYTLCEYFERFRPHFIVVSVYPNDFGNSLDVVDGGGDYWDEGMYWINAIESFCTSRSVHCLLVPVPLEVQVTSLGQQGHYPGRLSDRSALGSYSYLNPVGAFTDEHLRLVREGRAIGKRPGTSPLFNGHLKDAHFSAKGSAIWAREVGRRIALLFDPSAGPVEPAGR
jgi:hypothetical protein